MRAAKEAKQRQLVKKLKAWCLNQPYMTSEEFQVQTERVQRSVRAGCGNLPDVNGAPWSNGPSKTAEPQSSDQKLCLNRKKRVSSANALVIQ